MRIQTKNLEKQQRIFFMLYICISSATVMPQSSSITGEDLCGSSIDGWLMMLTKYISFVNQGRIQERKVFILHVCHSMNLRAFWYGENELRLHQLSDLAAVADFLLSLHNFVENLYCSVVHEIYYKLNVCAMNSFNISHQREQHLF